MKSPIIIYLFFVSVLSFESTSVIASDVVFQDTISAHELGEVIIKAQRNYVKKTDNGFNITIKGSPYADLNSVTGMMKQLPMIDAMSEGINVIGKKKTSVYINHHKVLDMAEVNNINPNQVKDVEIITSPSLKYGRDIDAVVIIHTLKPNEGFSTRAMGEYTNQRDINSFEISDNTSYTFENGWTVSGNISFSTYGNKGSIDNLDSYEGEYQTENNGINRYREKKLSTALYTFKETEKSSYGFRYLFDRMPSSNSTTTASYRSLYTDGMLHTGDYLFQERGSNYRHWFNLYYNTQLSKKLSILADANTYFGKRNSQFDTEIDAGATGQENVYSNHDMDYILADGELKFNYSAKKIAINWGINYSYTSTKQNTSGLNTPVDSKNYNDQYHSLYGVFADGRYNLTSDWCVGAGARLEVSDNRYRSTADRTNRTEVYFTPDVSIRFNRGGISTSLSYRSNLYRPVYYFLTSGYSFLSPTLWQTGNPLLKNDKEHEFNLDFSWKKTYIYLLYGISKNRCDYGLSYDAETRQSTMYPVSIPKMSNFAVLVQQRFDVGIWHPSVTGILLLQDLKFGTPERNFNKPYFRLQMKNRLSLPYGLQTYVNINYETAGNTNLYYVHSRFRTDILINKVLGAFSLDLSVNNIFDSWRLKYTLESNGVRYIMDNKPMGPVIKLSCVYTLNKSKKVYQGGHSSSEIHRF